MPIVSNTSPLLNLAIVNQLALVREQFEVVFIPPAVLVELRPNSQEPGAAHLQAALADGWLQVIPLTNTGVARALKRELDEGEAEAIALALQLGHNDVLIDEHDGRAVAKSMALRPIGLLGVLLRAKRQGTLATIAPILVALQNEAGFFISKALRAELLHQAGEN